MPDEEGLVHRDVLDTGDVRFVAVEDAVDEQERRAVGQHAADVVDVVEGRFAAVVGEAGLLAGLADGVLELLHELRVGEVPGAGGPHAALDAHAQQRKVAQQVEQLVTGQFVAAAQFEVAQVARLDLDVGFVEDLLEVFELLVGDGVLDHDDGVVQIAALDEVYLHQGFDLVQEDERAAGCDLLGVVVAGNERGVLVADDLRVVVDVYRDGELVVGVEDDGHALFGDGVDHLLGDVVERTFGLLVDQAGFGDGLGVGCGRSVENGGLFGVDVDHGVVDAQCPEGRHDVFDGMDAVSAEFDGRAARGVDHVVAQCRDYGLALDVGPSEDDAGIGLGGVDGHVHMNARMETLARERNRSFQGLLFG